MYAAVNATVYAIWRARNEALWNQQFPRVQHTQISDSVQSWWQGR